MFSVPGITGGAAGICDPLKVECALPPLGNPGDPLPGQGAFYGNCFSNPTLCMEGERVELSLK